MKGLKEEKIFIFRSLKETDRRAALARRIRASKGNLNSATVRPHEPATPWILHLFLFFRPKRV